VPAHDRVEGPNVMSTLTAPHGFSPLVLQRIRAAPPADIAALPHPRAAVILGGPNAVYRYGEDCALELATALASLGSLAVSFLITSSRRTPPYLLDAVREATAGAPRLIWDGSGENPYAAFLALADLFVVTADSVNMTGEACVTGRPVYVFEPDGGSAKFERFHQGLRRYGATRRLPESFARLETWSYAPLDSASVMASEIDRRWRAWKNDQG